MAIKPPGCLDPVSTGIKARLPSLQKKYPSKGGTGGLPVHGCEPFSDSNGWAEVPTPTHTSRIQGFSYSLGRCFQPLSLLYLLITPMAMMSRIFPLFILNSSEIGMLFGWPAKYAAGLMLPSGILTSFTPG